MGVEDVFKGGNIVTGLAIGVGVAVLAPVVKPLLRPASKALIKAGLEAYDQMKVTAAELGERTGDVVAEARAEMMEELRQSNGGDKKNGKGAKS
jgi:hypothetical protein